MCEYFDMMPPRYGKQYFEFINKLLTILAVH